MKLSTHLRRLCSSAAGFTMIELLIVVSILGILAVAVLSALNPLEQINRGRDTSSKSNAEQLINAVERYAAFSGYNPWQEDESDSAGLTAVAAPVKVDDGLEDSALCGMLAKLSNGDTGDADCPANSGTQELKASYIDTVNGLSDLRGLYIYNRGTIGDNTYVCYEPQSQAFINEAQTRCDLVSGPADIDATVWTDTICAGALTGGSGVPMVCLP